MQQTAHLLNLTGHPLSFFREDGSVMLVKASSWVAHCEEVFLAQDDQYGFSIHRKAYRNVQGLPPRQEAEGKLCVVSREVAMAAAFDWESTGDWDLSGYSFVFPSSWVFDEEGLMIGFRSFSSL